MKRKKIFAAGITIVLLAGCLIASGCRKEKKEITLNIKVPPLTLESEDMPELRDAYDLLKHAGDEFSRQYEDADININLVKFEYTMEDRFITECFDTPDAADILFEGYFNMASYIYTGRVVPLDDVLTEKMKEEIDPLFWELSSLNGRIYMLPFYTMQNTLCYNRNLFRQCGLDEFIGEKDTIQSWSIEEMEIILSTLKEKLPEMSYPMLMYGKNEQGDIHIMTLLRGRTDSFFDEEGNFNLSTPEGIAALQWLADSEKKGYFPPHCEDLEITDCMELFRNDQLAIGTANNVTIKNISNSEEDRIGLVNFPNVDGSGYNTSFLTGFEVFDNGDQDKIKAAKAFIQYLYDQKIYMNCSKSGIPVSREIAADMEEDARLMDAYMENSVNTVRFTVDHPNWRGVRNVFWPQINELLEGSMTAEEAAEAIDRRCNEAIKNGRENSKFHE